VGDPRPGAPPHHRTRGFVNLNGAYTRPDAWTRTRFFVRRILGSTLAPRSFSLPAVPNDGRALRDNRGAPTVTWVGHATLLVQLDGVSFLTDPQWSERASPLSFAGPRRLVPPGLAFEDLPPIHFVVISHAHYDHLDVATVTRLARTHRPRFLVPLGLKAWFAELGITDVDELDWWDSRSVRGLTVTCVPVQHWSQRTLWDTNRTLWAGWTVTGPARRLFFAGDTGYHEPTFREIGARLGPFDLAAIPIGAYLPPAMMRFSHVDPRQALRVFDDVKGRRFVALHWGTFDLADEPLDEPPRLLEAEARRLGLGPDRVWVLHPGETRPW
jgi:L-ascorbate metabolism protein UlaG (beta-lactamase superfamily)